MTLSEIPGEIVAFVARVILRVCFRVKVNGTLKRENKMLIVANHTSFIDGILLGAFLPITPTYLVHTVIAKLWYFRLPLMFIRHLVVDTANPMAMKAIVGLVDSGKPVVIFPEGRISVTGSLMKIYDGPAFVVARTGASVIPVHIDGAVFTPFSRMTGDFPRKVFPRITITIHPPSLIPMPEGRTAKIRRRLASDRMRRIMQHAAYASRKPKSLYDAFLEAAGAHGGERGLLEDINAKPQSYKDLIKASMALGRLVSRFTKESEVAGVLLPNVNSTVSLLLGMWAMRRTPGMLNFTAGAEGMQHACRLAKIGIIFTSRAFIEKAKLAQAIEKLENVRIIYLEDLKPQFSLIDKLWLILYAVRFPHRVRRRVPPGEAAVVLFTSGSEGMPKGVVLSHDSILANTAQISAAFPFSSKEKFMSALPIFHAFGLTAGVVLPLLNGCRVFLYPSPLHYRAIPEIIYDRDCTVLFATNTFLGNYVKAAHQYDFYSIKYLVVGAEKLTEEVQRACVEKFGIRALEGYGATECGPVISVNTPLAARAGTVGELLPGMDYRIAPVPGIDAGGGLHVRGDNLMLGYLKHDQPGVVQPPESEFGKGWYDTGDIVTVDQQSYVTIQGRMKRFAKVAGEMVSLETVERIAIAAQPNHIHASTAIKDPSRGELILLFTQDRDLRREQLQAAARSMGAPEIAIPRRIIHIDKIPMLGNGKKDYVTLGKMAAQSEQTAGRS